MSSSPVLGIDLGTTNSVVALADGTRVQVLVDADGNRLIPSVVSFHPQGDVLVGYAARERRLLDAKNTVYSVKRLIGRPFDSPEVTRARSRFAFDLVEGPNKSVLVKARNETYTLPEISAFVLREVRRVAEQALGQECSRAVITVPANFNELQRAATKAAGKVAGLEVMRILNEPTAAALAYGYGRSRDSSPRGGRERIAVYDFGGGTFDVTILELAGDVFEVVATAGDTFLGGDDVDVLIAEEMAGAFLAHHRFDPRNDAQAYERLRAAAEWSKCQLTFEPEVHLRVEELAYGETGASLDLTFGLSRTALEKLARPLVERSFAVCDDAMRVAGIAPTQLDSVILVGGTTRMPLVRQMVKEYFGQEPETSIDPDLVVSQGAALQGFSLRADRGSMPPSKAVGRVTLKKAGAPDPKRDARRAELKKETEAARPKQPAFAPREAPPVPRPVAVPPPPPAPPPSGEFSPNDEDAPTRAGVRAYQPDGVPTDAPTRAGVSLADVAPTLPSAPPPPSVPAPPLPSRGRVAPPPAPTPAVVVQAPAVVTGKSVAIGERASRVPKAPAAPPRPPPAMPVPELSVPAFPGLTDDLPPPPVPEPLDLGEPEVPSAPSAWPPPPQQAHPSAPPARSQPAAPASAWPQSQQAPQQAGWPQQQPQQAGWPQQQPQQAGWPQQQPQQAGWPQQQPQQAGWPQQQPQQAGWPQQQPQQAGWPQQQPQQAGWPQQQPQQAGWPQQAAPVAMEIVGSGAPAPLLLDVTPHTLGVETVSGFCEAVIKRNAAIPVEQTRVFTTANDGQLEVRVRIVQGESRRLEENQQLGEILLSGIRQERRGHVKIGVTFVMDANGTLGVKAKDLESGREQSIRVQLVGAMPDAEIQRMQERQNQIFGQ
jgi:molecular chaperone DnaK